MTYTHEIPTHAWSGSSGVASSTTGNRVAFDQRVILKSIWFQSAGYVPSYSTPRKVKVYTDTGTLLADVTAPAVELSAGTWLEVPLPSPVTLEPNTVYRICVYHPSGGSSYPGAWSVSGLTFPHAHPSTPAAIGSTTYDGRVSYGDTFPTTVEAGKETVLRYGVDLANANPHAPTLTTMADGGIVDRAATNRASHAFSDPDAGDSQSKFDHRYRLVGAGTWTEATEITPNQYVDYPAGTFSAGDYERQVRTYDALGFPSPWSASGYFSAADAPPTPTITAPVHLSTASSSTSVTWSTPEQSAYQLQVLDGGLVEYDTGTVEEPTTRTREAVPLPVNNEDRTIRVRIRSNGLWSAWYSVTVSVAFTPPEVPQVALQAVGTTIVVQVTNPAGTTPVTHNRVLIDDGDGEALRAAAVAANGAWTYWTPRSGLDYEGRVRVVAVGDNGTEASSA